MRFSNSSGRDNTPDRIPVLLPMRSLSLSLSLSLSASEGVGILAPFEFEAEFEFDAEGSRGKMDEFLDPVTELGLDEETAGGA